MEEYLTFDDVLIKPKYSEINSRSDVSLKTKLTKNIQLSIPLISANMDTITEDKMAIKMALNGGIGIIHRFCSIDEQVTMVKKVKRFTNYRIDDPYTIHPNVNIFTLEKQMLEKNVSSFLVADNINRLVGIVTRRDLLFSKCFLNNENSNESIMVKDIMVPYENLILTKNIDIDIDTALKTIYNKRVEKLPIIDSDNKIKGLITAKDLLSYKYSCNNSTLDEKLRLRCGAAIGINDDFIKRAIALTKSDVDVLVVDIAHAHCLQCYNAIMELREKFDELNLKLPELIVGNVCTAEGVRYLVKAGADAIKVNIGAGSICTTRIVTGCGVPQLSAIIECVKEANKYNIPIIGDGGHNGKIGNIFKCLAAGASTVMLGGFLSGTDETPGNIVVKNGKKMKIIRGMAGYLSNFDKKNKLGYGKDIENICPEGVEGYVDYKGDVSSIISQVVKGIKSGMSYVGSSDFNHLHKENEITFIKISNSGIIESNSHNISRI